MVGTRCFADVCVCEVLRVCRYRVEVLLLFVHGLVVSENSVTGTNYVKDQMCEVYNKKT